MKQPTLDEARAEVARLQAEARAADDASDLAAREAVRLTAQAETARLAAWAARDTARGFRRALSEANGMLDDLLKATVRGTNGLRYVIESDGPRQARLRLAGGSASHLVPGPMVTVHAEDRHLLKCLREKP